MPVVNLVRNAIDAIGEAANGQIQISLAARDPIEIEVTDNGRGLGDMTMEDLTEPFFSTKPSGEGMGLGLAISAQIINEMGGTIDARPGPQGGATFIISLPKAV